MGVTVVQQKKEEGVEAEAEAEYFTSETLCSRFTTSIQGQLETDTRPLEPQLPETRM